MNLIKLKNWAIVSCGDAYTAPEAKRAFLYGELVEEAVIHGKKRCAGRAVVTSRIAGSNGRVVQTAHSFYELVGEPSGGYRDWRQANGILINKHSPILVHPAAR